MRRIFCPNERSMALSTGMLVLRIVMGAAFMFHGWGKIQHPISWMGENAPVPGILQAAAAVAEFCGGAALIIGLLTRLAALGLAITMAVAAGMVHIQSGHAFVGKGGEPSWELAAVYFACAILFLLAGPGLFSLDAALFKPREASPVPRSL
jgi:putative oxidoreductase